MQRFQCVIFDLDGTLLDTLQDLADAANRVLERAGLPQHPVSAYRYFVGDGLTALIERIVPESDRTPRLLASLAEDFRRDYGRHWREATRPYDGVEEMLAGLERLGLPVSVLSNKPHEFTQACVEAYFPGVPFRRVLGHREGGPRKPDPGGALAIAADLGVDPATCLYLGDTATDMQTATRAAMYPVGALWGFREGEELLRAGARHLLAHPRELLQLVELHRTS